MGILKLDNNNYLANNFINGEINVSLYNEKGKMIKKEILERDPNFRDIRLSKNKILINTSFKKVKVINIFTTKEEIILETEEKNKHTTLLKQYGCFIVFNSKMFIDIASMTPTNRFLVLNEYGEIIKDIKVKSKTRKFLKSLLDSKKKINHIFLNYYDKEKNKIYLFSTHDELKKIFSINLDTEEVQEIVLERKDEITNIDFMRPVRIKNNYCYVAYNLENKEFSVINESFSSPISDNNSIFIKDNKQYIYINLERRVYEINIDIEEFKLIRAAIIIDKNKFVLCIDDKKDLVILEI